MTDPKSQLINSRPMTDVKRTTPSVPYSQSESFVRGRAAWIQYSIDVFALAFILSIGLFLVQRYIIK